MKTTDIIDRIYEDFGKVYKNAKPFINSGAVWDFCIESIKDPSLLYLIVVANDMGVPPVKSLINLYARKKDANKEFTATQSQCMGALMGFVFKEVLGYTKENQKERCSVYQMGIKTATRFERSPDQPFLEFEAGGEE